MRDLKNTCRVAVVQATPVMFRKDKCLEKALRLIDEAAGEGAELIVFPELFIPGYPYGMTFGFTVGSRKAVGREDWKMYYDNSLLADGPEMRKLLRRARELGVYISMGYSERDAVTGTLYNANMMISPEGEALNHRKLKPTGAEGDQADLYALAEKAGYHVVKTQAEAEQVTGGPVVIIDEHLADSDAMAYEIDRTDDMWALADYVEKGIEVLSQDKDGFFMMCEGGKIDWACHANDAAASIHDVIEMHNAVQAAVEFYAQHPDDTLILVTADHETGGLGIGYKTTNYDTFLTNLAHQKMSYAKFDSTYVNNYVKNQTPFETAMQDVKANFGLTLPTDPDAASAGKLLLTDYEVENLRTAYERTLKVGSSSQSKMSQQDYELYGTYIPFSMAICHTINHKSGVDHTTYAHTGAMVNLYARGQGADKFRGVYDNTEIFHKLAELTDVQ